MIYVTICFCFILLIIEVFYLKNSYTTLKTKGALKLTSIKQQIKKEKELQNSFHADLLQNKKVILQQKINDINIKTINLSFSYEELTNFL